MFICIQYFQRKRHFFKRYPVRNDIISVMLPSASKTIWVLCNIILLIDKEKDMKKLVFGIALVSMMVFFGCASGPQLTPEQQAAQNAWEAANPQYTSASHFEWREIEGGVRITRYTGPGGAVQIPPQINGLPVIEITGRAHRIGDVVPFHIGAFHATGVTSVTIPDSVTNIGGGAFARNQLVELDIPDSVTNIGMGAFSYNPLSGNVIVPAGASVGTNAFMRGRNARGESVPSTVTRITPEQRLMIAEDPSELQRLQAAQAPARQGSGLQQYRGFEWRRNSAGTGITISGWIPGTERDLIIPAYIEGLPVVSISIDEWRATWETNPPRWDFGRRGITSITLPDSIVFIGEGSFHTNHLTSVTIPAGVTRIDAGAFASNRLTSVHIPDRVTSIGQEAFAFNPLTSITIGNGLASINESVFWGSLRDVTQISIGANVNLIGNSEVVWRMFRVAYEANGARAGVYTLRDGTWSWQAR